MATFFGDTGKDLHNLVVWASNHYALGLRGLRNSLHEMSNGLAIATAAGESMRPVAVKRRQVSGCGKTQTVLQRISILPGEAQVCVWNVTGRVLMPSALNVVCCPLVFCMICHARAGIPAAGLVCHLGV